MAKPGWGEGLGKVATLLVVPLVLSALGAYFVARQGIAVQREAREASELDAVVKAADALWSSVYACEGHAQEAIKAVQFEYVFGRGSADTDLALAAWKSCSKETQALIAAKQFEAGADVTELAELYMAMLYQRVSLVELPMRERRADPAYRQSDSMSKLNAEADQEFSRILGQQHWDAQSLRNALQAGHPIRVLGGHAYVYVEPRGVPSLPADELQRRLWLMRMADDMRDKAATAGGAGQASAGAGRAGAAGAVNP
jgi:hypothetical protein